MKNFAKKATLLTIALVLSITSVTALANEGLTTQETYAVSTGIDIGHDIPFVAGQTITVFVDDVEIIIVDEVSVARNHQLARRMFLIGGGFAPGGTVTLTTFGTRNGNTAFITRVENQRTAGNAGLPHIVSTNIIGNGTANAQAVVRVSFQVSTSQLGHQFTNLHIGF
ncbi:MAG: hypothetical protein FWG63_08170 [Defluviitaleaceae bacterium]|nr:hypothetical protein [Defluviitaleaceae bacterium]